LASLSEYTYRYTRIGKGYRMDDPTRLEEKEAYRRMEVREIPEETY